MLQYKTLSIDNSNFNLKHMLRFILFTLLYQIPDFYCYEISTKKKKKEQFLEKVCNCSRKMQRKWVYFSFILINFNMKDV